MNFKLNESLGFILNKVNTKLKNELFQQLKEFFIVAHATSPQRF